MHAAGAMAEPRAATLIEPAAGWPRLYANVNTASLDSSGANTTEARTRTPRVTASACTRARAASRGRTYRHAVTRLSTDCVGGSSCMWRREGKARLLGRPLRKQVDAAAYLAVHGVEDGVRDDGRHLRCITGLGAQP